MAQHNRHFSAVTTVGNTPMRTPVRGATSSTLLQRLVPDSCRGDWLQLGG